MSALSLFPIERAARIAVDPQHKGTEVGDLAVSYLALASVHTQTIDERDEFQQALEVSLVRLGLGQKYVGENTQTG